jgi:hypothetical protein
MPRSASIHHNTKIHHGHKTIHLTPAAPPSLNLQQPPDPHHNLPDRQLNLKSSPTYPSRSNRLASPNPQATPNPPNLCPLHNALLLVLIPLSSKCIPDVPSPLSTVISTPHHIVSTHGRTASQQRVRQWSEKKSAK